MAAKETRDVAAKLAQIAHGIADGINRKPSGVKPQYSPILGGTVDETGRFRYAGGGPLLCVATYTAAPTTVTTSSARVQFDTVGLDPRGIITTGASWKIDLPYVGWYRAFVHLQIDKKNNTAAAGEVWQAVLYDDTLSTIKGVLAQLEFFVAVSSATHSAYDLVGSRAFQVTSLPAAIAVAFDRNTTTQNRDIVGGQFELDYIFQG